MIEPPRRSVTHFLVPFIDVTLILFSMFLLLPMGSTEKQREQDKLEQVSRLNSDFMQNDITKLRELLEVKKKELDLKNAELEKYVKDKNLYKEILDLRDLVKKLEKERDLAKKTPNFIRVVDIDPKDGKIFFYDPFLPDPRWMITDKTKAEALIARHRQEAGERRLYYHFMFPRVDTGYPTAPQERDYITWFAGVPNSLTEKMP